MVVLQIFQEEHKNLLVGIVLAKSIQVAHVETTFQEGVSAYRLGEIAWHRVVQANVMKPSRFDSS